MLRALIKSPQLVDRHLEYRLVANPIDKSFKNVPSCISSHISIASSGVPTKAAKILIKNRYSRYKHEQVFFLCRRIQEKSMSAYINLQFTEDSICCQLHRQPDAGKT